VFMYVCVLLRLANQWESRRLLEVRVCVCVCFVRWYVYQRKMAIFVIDDDGICVWMYACICVYCSE
jgi:hypothetical protein